MIRTGIFAAMIATVFFTLGACETDGASSDAMEPAVLASWDAETMTKVKAVLASAMGKANIELGAGDPTRMSTISVLPRPLNPNETMSTATPTPFDIMMNGDRCFVVRRNTGKAYKLGDVSCRAAAR